MKNNNNNINSSSSTIHKVEKVYLGVDQNRIAVVSDDDDDAKMMTNVVYPEFYT